MHWAKYPLKVNVIIIIETFIDRWNQRGEKFTLEDVSLNLSGPQLVMIVGEVGQGKVFQILQLHTVLETLC